MNHRTSAVSSQVSTSKVGIALLLSLSVLAGACSSSEQTATDASPATAVVETTKAPAPTTTKAPAETTPPTTAEPAPSTTEAPMVDEPRYELIGELDLTVAELNDMVAFVEETMDRPFKTPPKIVLQSVEEFEAGLVPDAEMQAIQESQAESSARFFQALGQTTLGADELLAKLKAVGSSTDLISGRYIPEDDAVYIPEGVLGGDTFNAILVHELAHALDGQYVDLAAIVETLQAMAAGDEITDAGFPIQATVEGRATAVQGRWMMANNVIPEDGGIPDSFNELPPSVITSVLLPYQLGAQSIEALGGPANTWNLFDEFPSSSEQMIFSDRIGTDLPSVVEAPVAQNEISSEGILGAEGILLLLLGESLTPGQIEVVTALTAADGWGGDRFIVDGDETASCFRANMVADSAAEFAELEAAFTGWASKESVPGAERSVMVDGEMLLLTACAPFIP